MVKQIITILIILVSIANADVQLEPVPSSIEANSLISKDSCNIQLVSEIVKVNLYNDSARVECTFELHNFGEELNSEIGFPAMQFFSRKSIEERNFLNFIIEVDDTIYNEEQIKVPAELDSTYRAYMKIRNHYNEYMQKYNIIKNYYHIGFTGWRGMDLVELLLDDGSKPNDSLYNIIKSELLNLKDWWHLQYHIADSLYRQITNKISDDKYPWYVWKINFQKNENKILKITYNLPAYQGDGSDYRYFTYLLNTGSGWKGFIERADIIVHLHYIPSSFIEKISPTGFSYNKENNIIVWTMINLEPTKDDDIFIQYFKPDEKWGILRFFNPTFWKGKLFE